MGLTTTAAPVRPQPRPTPPPVAVGPPQRSRGQRLVRGAEGDPRWARPALLSLLVATAVLYLWDLSASGWANSFYSAAVQAGTQSWKAFFFGSLDAGNAITVDKPPMSLWPMELSGRLFGFSSWSMLVPQALEGVAAVGLLYGAVRRVSGHAAGLVAGAVLALTPAAVLMFRFNNPDALLVLELVAAAYCVTRALEKAGTRWIVAAGILLGFGFITKMGQALLVLPALGLGYLIAAPTSLGRRLLQLFLGWTALLVGAGWYVLAVALTPAADRPYIGGSGNNSVLGLAFGYNGLGRLFGGQGNGGGGGGGAMSGNARFGGTTGLTRVLSSEMGLEASWLLPAALVALVAGLALTLRRHRGDRARAGLVLWGGWLLVTALVFDYMQGTIHPYYTVALAPAVAACVAIGGQQLWSAMRRTGSSGGAVRTRLAALVGLAAMVIATVVWDVQLLHQSSWNTWEPYPLVVLGALAIGGLVAAAMGVRRAMAVAALSGALTLGGGTAAWGVATAAASHTGSIPSSGPSSSAGAMGGPGGGFGGGATGTRPALPGGATGATRGGFPGGSTTGRMTGRMAGGPGGDTATNSALTALLKASTTRWAAATSGAQSAASLELASGASVIGIGGFTGTDNAPTLAQFRSYVAQGLVHYFVGGQGGGFGGGQDAAGIATWVAAHYTATTVGGQTVYDLTQPASS
jgi:4-amino-4-deoxy-L-arabinose transferase-like glycosyltransferase